MTNAARRGAGTDAHVGKQHRQQHQIGKNQQGHTDACCHGQAADHRDVDQEQYRETDGIGQQRGQSGQEEATEREARRHVPVHAAPDVLHDAVHLLGAVRNADREHQERDEDRIRIERVAGQVHGAELPQHRHHRTTDHEQRASEAAGVQEDHHQRHDQPPRQSSP